MNNDILADLIDWGEVCKSCLLELDSENEPLKVRYIKVDDELISQWDNSKDSKFVRLVYHAIVKLVSNKYKSDNLSVSYSNKTLKLVYLVNNAKYTATLL